MDQITNHLNHHTGKGRKRKKKKGKRKRKRLLLAYQLSSEYTEEGRGKEAQAEMGGVM